VPRGARPRCFGRRPRARIARFARIGCLCAIANAEAAGRRSHGSPMSRGALLCCGWRLLVAEGASADSGLRLGRRHPEMEALLDADGVMLNRYDASQRGHGCRQFGIGRVEGATGHASKPTRART